VDGADLLTLAETPSGTLPASSLQRGDGKGVTFSLSATNATAFDTHRLIDRIPFT
jgi:hypothetical protein